MELLPANIEATIKYNCYVIPYIDFVVLTNAALIVFQDSVVRAISTL